MSYPGAIRYLYDLQKHSIKLGLERTEKLLAALNHPNRCFLSVHVAGTNGKGSVSAMIASMLMADGCKVGLFTSPHMVSFTERMRINNVLISEQEVEQLTGEIREIMSPVIAEAGEPTFFEFVTAMAFLYFARNNVDWAVIETGMGGRLDSTNTIRPAVSVITSINYDHKEFLGNSLPEIASEKAGIIKSGVPVVCSAQEPEAEKVLRDKAAAESSPIFIYGKDFSGSLESTDLTGTGFSYNSGNRTVRNLYVPLAGEHQLGNACVAVHAFLLCAKSGSLDAVKEGLASVKWPGRLEFIDGNPPVVLDGAHNPHAARALAEFMRKRYADRRIVLIAGIMSDKEIIGILAPLLPIASDIFFTALKYPRSAQPGLLAEHAASMGYKSEVARSMEEAIASARKAALAGSSDPELPALILITGSFFTVGEAKEFLGEKPVLGDLRENYKK